MKLDVVETLKQIFIAGAAVIKPATYQFSFDSGVDFSVTATGADILLDEGLPPVSTFAFFSTRKIWPSASTATAPSPICTAANA